MPSMLGVYLPGDSTAEVRSLPVPEPAHGQVLLRVLASTICGSDLRAIYHGHVGPEQYLGVVAGHEPCGEVVALGPGAEHLQVGDRVVVYHVRGCGRCPDCRAGYLISCSAPAPVKAGYGWQLDGGHAEQMVVDEAVCLRLPDALTPLDGACVACGFGTAYEALCRAEVSGRDTVLVTGLGPVGLAVGTLARAMGARVVGADVVPARMALAGALGCVDEVVPPDAAALDTVRELTDGHGCEVAVDCSGAAPARELAVRGTRRWGRCVLVGEGGRLDLDVSDWLIHQQVSLHGSWVTSLPRMAALLELLVRWDVHPERLVTDRFDLTEADAAYRTAAGGAAGKVAILPNGRPAAQARLPAGPAAGITRRRLPL